MDRSEPYEEWYRMSPADSSQLRDLLTNRRTKIEDILYSLESSSMEYLNNFSNYITADNPKFCKDLFENRTNYRMGDVIGKGKVGTVSLLTNDRTQLIIKSMSAAPKKYLSLRIIDYIDNDLDNEYWIIKNQKNERKILSIGGDNFSNQTSIHLILNLILKDNIHYIHQYDAFYCDKSGYNVIEFCNAGDLHRILETKQIDDLTLMHIMKQVLTPLAILKYPEYNFNHSDLKAKNIFVHEINGEYFFKIADYDKSSITWNGFRFYNWSLNYIASPIKIYKKNNKLYYTISSNVNLQLQTMHNPYGIPGSYDIYTFIISLFAADNIWNNYIKNRLPKLKRIIHAIFEGDIYYKIMGKIANDNKSLVSMGAINAILNGVELQYDLSYLYKSLGLIPPKLIPEETRTMNILQSDNNHLCSNDCRVRTGIGRGYKTCNTNVYTDNVRGILYDWDYCKA